MRPRNLLGLNEKWDDKTIPVVFDFDRVYRACLRQGTNTRVVLQLREQGYQFASVLRGESGAWRCAGGSIEPKRER